VTPNPDAPTLAGDSGGGPSPFGSGGFSGGSSGGGGGGDSGGGYRAPKPATTPAAKPAQGTACNKLMASMDLNSSPTSQPSQLDDAWALSTGLGLAGNGLSGMRTYVGASGARSIGGGSVGKTIGEIGTEVNILGGLGITISGANAVSSFGAGDIFGGAVSSFDVVAGFAAFFTGPDIWAARYFGGRLGNDLFQAALPARPTVLDRLTKLQSAGCL
jgi:hypothetical protein